MLKGTLHIWSKAPSIHQVRIVTFGNESTKAFQLNMDIIFSENRIGFLYYEPRKLCKNYVQNVNLDKSAVNSLTSVTGPAARSSF